MVVLISSPADPVTPLSGPRCLWNQEGCRARRGGEHLEQVQGVEDLRGPDLRVCVSLLFLRLASAFLWRLSIMLFFPPPFSTVYLPKPLFLLNLFQPHVLHFATTLGLYPSRASSADPHATSFIARLLRVRVTIHSHPQSPGNREVGLESESSFRICFSFQSLCCLKLEARGD